jgi:hypothetical protein
MFVANEDSDNIVAFGIDQKTEMLSLAARPSEPAALYASSSDEWRRNDQQQASVQEIAILRQQHCES